MLTEKADVIRRMLQLRKERKEFVGDDYGTFYRTQKLRNMIWNGDITDDNLSEMMTSEKMSEGGVPPVEWYHLKAYPHPQDAHYELFTQNLNCAKDKRNKRARLTKLRVRKILFDILMARLDRFENPEKYMNNKILCIVGESGAGKTLASLHLQNKLGANVICSFTTRPPRSTEIEGREHHFINIVPDPNELLAYTLFHGNEYYALKTQVFGECTVYVIDEDGLRNLREEHGDEYRIFSVYITRKKKLRRKVGISHNRIDRDDERKKLPMSEYDWVIENNSTKKDFFVKIENIYREVFEK